MGKRVIGLVCAAVAGSFVTVVPVAAGQAAAPAVQAAPAVRTTSAVRTAPAVQTAPAGRTAHVARVLDTDRTGLARPAGVVFSRRAGSLTVTESAGGASSTTLTRLSAVGRPASTATVATGLTDPVDMAFDDSRHRLVALQPQSQRLVTVSEGADGNLVASSLRVSDARPLGVDRPAGLAFDGAGDLFVLDATGPRLVRVVPTSVGDLAAGTVTSVPLDSLSGRDVRGLAYDPGTGHLHVLEPAAAQLHELTATGAAVGTRDLSAAHLRDPQGMVFAPSGDLTDDPSVYDLFVADAGGTTVGAGAGKAPAMSGTSAMASSGQVVELSFAADTTSASADVTSTLLNTVDTAQISPPSPDPSGLAYWPEANRLVMTDGEVEETVNGITHFQGANTWELTLGGSVLRTANLSKVAPTTVKMTNEPTGIAWNPNTGHWFVTDDDAQRVYDLNPGPDKLIGTTDDTFTYFSTLGADDGDPEGVAYDPKHDRIYVADGVNQEIYEWTPSGTLVGHFDVEAYGALDPESVEYNPDSDTLLVLSNHGNRVIVETALNGAYIRTIDISAANAIAPAGLAYAPSSSGSGMSYYVVDRAVDNNDDPNIIDGKMFELSAAPTIPPGNVPPVVDAGPDQNVVLPATATIDATVTDDGLPNPPGSVTTSWTQVSGPSTVKFSDPSVVDTTATFPIAGTYVLRLRAYDGQATVTDDVTMNVTGRSNIAAIDARVSASADDAEEQTTGTMSMTSAKLDMMLDVATTTNTNAMIGMRFPALGLPQGAKITNAYLQFTAAQVQTGPMTLTMQAQAADDAPALTSTKFSLTSRARTTAAVGWDVPSWVQVNDSAAAQRSPDLTPVVQEVVNRTGWTPTSALALLVTGAGSGIRVARSFDGAAAQAPLLHVEYDTGAAFNAAPTVTIGSPAANATANQGDPVPFQATAQDNEDGNVAGSLVWTSSIDGRIGTGGSFSRSDLSVGTHTITATATDSNGVSSSATRTLNILAPAPVLVGAGDIGDCSQQGDEATANILDGTPGSVFTLGDNAYQDGTAAEFSNCYDPNWGRHKLRTWPVVGNHDYHTAGAAGYFGYFGAAAGPAGLGYYSYDVAGWHVVVLNSEIDTSAGGAQETWLRGDLAAHPAACTVAMWHRPLFTSGVLDGPSPAMKPLWQALYDYGADLVLNGHEHSYERFAPQTPDGVADSTRGIREFVVGTGGASESGYTFGTPVPNSEVRALGVTGLLKLTLKAGGYDWQFLGVPGQTFADSGSGTCVGNKAPVVDAGPDASVTLPAAATLSGAASDDGLPTGSTVTTSWSKVSGPGTVTFADPAAASTTATFSTSGSYVLRLTASDGALTSSDDVTVTVNPANTAPLVSAGPDQTITLPAGATLSGAASDDGLPSGTLTTTWSQVSGPGTVTFADPAAQSTTATFSTSGSYVLRLTASDGALTSSDDVAITVQPSDLIFADGFESGSFSAWTSSVTDGGNLSVSGAAALAGTYGMQALINDNTPIYVTDSSPAAEPRYRARFRFKPNSIKMAKGDQHVILSGINATGTAVVQVELRFDTSYQVRADITTDTTTVKSTAWVTITNATHAFEFDWRASTAAGANNGRLTFWVDGTQKADLKGIDNDTRRVESVQLGAVSGIDSGTRGTYWFDAFESRRSTYIGP